MARKNNMSNKYAKKTLIALVSVAMLIFMTAVGVYAFLIDRTNEVDNVFDPTSFEIVVEEEFENNIKKDVLVSNLDGETATDCYVRVALITNWYTDITVEDEVVQQLVGKAAWDINNEENNLVLNTDDWFKGNDGYYYYKYVLEPGQNTTNLINSIELVVDENDGTYQGLEIIAEGIQAYPETTVESIWGVDVVDGNLTK